MVLVLINLQTQKNLLLNVERQVVKGGGSSGTRTLDTLRNGPAGEGIFESDEANLWHRYVGFGKNPKETTVKS